MEASELILSDLPSTQHGYHSATLDRGCATVLSHTPTPYQSKVWNR